MEWSNVALCSVITICATVIIAFIVKCREKLKMDKLSFEQNEKLEDKKQANAKELICMRNAEKPKEDLSQKVAELNQIVKELNEKIKAADDTTKQNLEKAKAQIEIYEKFLNKKA